MNFLLRLLIPLLATLLVSCGGFQSEPEPEIPERRLIGTIDSVHQAGFVLIRLNGSLTPPTEAVLVSDGPQGKANLRLTGEKVGLFVAADLRSGTPMKNDGVYLYEKVSDLEDNARAGGLTYDNEPGANYEGEGEIQPESHAESALPSES